MTKMTEIFERQGVALDQESYAEAKTARRAKNIAAAHEVLTRNGIPYVELDNQIFRVECEKGLIYYHPPTGEWKEVSNELGHRGFGIRNLVRHIKGEVK